VIENSSEAGRGLSSRFILPRRERPLLAGKIPVTFVHHLSSLNKGNHDLGDVWISDLN